MSAVTGNEFAASLSQSMRAAREAHGLTQAELSRAIGASRAHVSTIEGGIRLPSLEVVAQWAEACRVPLSTLFAGVTGTPPKRKRRTKQHGQEGHP